MHSKANSTEVPYVEEGEGRVPLFMPYVSPRAAKMVSHVLETRWIGQGPLVTDFENEFKRKFVNTGECIAVGSGTDALHLAYLLANIQPGDEVLVPVFTCTATNIPLLYIGAKIKFIDVDPETLNISIEDLKRKISKKTKAVVVVHYGGLPCNMDEVGQIAKEYNAIVIEDAAHALGAKYKSQNIGEISDFTMFSFQAVKHITTGDGGILTFKNPDYLEKAKKLRWFGIDRNAKQKGIWENDIVDIGYKYQMTDLAAALGLTALSDIGDILKHRTELLQRYNKNLEKNAKLKIVGKPNNLVTHAAWMFTILTDRRRELQIHLYNQGIESNQVHYRNDRYSIFSQYRENLPNMDSIEDKYLVLPLHMKMNLNDVDRICGIVSDFLED